MNNITKAIKVYLNRLKETRIRQNRQRFTFNIPDYLKETSQQFTFPCIYRIIIIIEMNIIKVALSHFCCRTTVQSDSVSVARQVTVRR